MDDDTPTNAPKPASYEVTVTVPRTNPDASLVPCPRPVVDGAITVWQQGRVMIGLIADAADEATAIAAGSDAARKIVGAAARAEVKARPADTSGIEGLGPDIRG